MGTKKSSVQTPWSNDRQYAYNRRKILIELIVSVQKRYDMFSFGEWTCWVTGPRKYRNGAIFNEESRNINTDDRTISDITTSKIDHHHSLGVDCLWLMNAVIFCWDNTDSLITKIQHVNTFLSLEMRWIWIYGLHNYLVNAQRFLGMPPVTNVICNLRISRHVFGCKYRSGNVFDYLDSDIGSWNNTCDDAIYWLSSMVHDMSVLRLDHI